MARRESALPSTDLSFEGAADVVVVGSGVGGLTTALFNAWRGSSVVVLEKAPEIGGTSLKSGFVFWVPNNSFLRTAGIHDRQADFLRYAARTARPEAYDPESATLGLSGWEFEGMAAFHESACDAFDELSQRAKLPFYQLDWYDYWSELPENRVPRGRALAVVDVGADHGGSDEPIPQGGGMLAHAGGIGIEILRAAALEAGVEMHVGHRVQRVIKAPDRRVVGVVATTADGVERRLGARKAVVFASGGFTHDRELRENFLSGPVVYGCAAKTNEGDFVRIGTAAGAQLRSMQHAWWNAVNLDAAVEARADFMSTFIIAGDSMICVNYRGERCVNEKLPYNELGIQMQAWDPLRGEHPNRVLIQIWDQHSQDHSAMDEGDTNIVPAHQDQSHVVSGSTLEQLAERVDERLARFRGVTGNVRLAEDFVARLRETVARWNEMSRNGVDEDFGRGGRPIEVFFMAGPVDDDPRKRNQVMHPISEHGPYYASLVAPGTLDTKGGPKTDTRARVLDDLDEPIPGLYGVGNCVAAVSSRAYWAAGGTLGPIVTFAYRAAEAIDREPLRDLPIQARLTA